jgi:Asp-tRNA(Asn)/Glu-tRNA(Gln) amidotransferase A subunit family amidase
MAGSFNAGLTGSTPRLRPSRLISNPSSAATRMSADGLPLGLQVMGFSAEDARLFGIAATIRDQLGGAA